MKYFIRTDINKVSVANNKGETKIYSSTPFKRDEKDLASRSKSGFMTYIDLLKWYTEEYGGTEENPSLDRLESLWLENGSNTISYTAQKISKMHYDQIKEKFPNADIVEFNNKGIDTYVANGDILFLDNLERNNVKYELV